MAEAKYPCPQCKASLKLKQEVPPGKKIKCPKCEAVFAPVAEKPKPAPAQAAADDEDAGGIFGFKEETPPPRPDADAEDGAAGGGQKPESMIEDVQERLKKRFPKSKRGPAQALVMKASNQLLATASTVCVSCIISVIVALWPMMFSLGKKLTGEEIAQSWLTIGFCVIAFLYNGVITYGAVKLQSIESLAWATVGSIMMLLPVNWVLGIPAFYWFLLFVGSLAPVELVWGTVAVISLWFLYVGSWNLMMIRKPEVLEGFYEKRVNY